MFDLFGMSIKVPAEEAQRFSVRRAYRCIYIYILSLCVQLCSVPIRLCSCYARFSSSQNKGFRNILRDTLKKL